jgi:hypothetical protein
VTGFASDLLRALATVATIDSVSLTSEGPIVKGRAILASPANTFLDIYLNSRTGTLAFALVKDQRRIWGVDRDTVRGWHEHPLNDPEAHVAIDALSVADIVHQLASALQDLYSAARREGG